jgi:uncharacterized protein (DUF885 family)
MKKQILVLAVLATLLISCRENPKSIQSGSGDAAFQKLSDEFLDGYLAWRPEYAVYLGIHEYDGKITDFSKQSIDSELIRLKTYEQKFSAIDSASLSPEMYYDLRILLGALMNEIFNFEDLQIFKKNPLVYFEPSPVIDGFLAIDLSLYLNRSFAPFEERIKSIVSLEKEIPGIVTNVESNLADSLAKPYINSTIETVKGSVSFLENDLVDAVKNITNDSLKTAFNTSNKKAVSSLNEFIQYLEKEKLPKANNRFAIGRDNYIKMLSYEYVTISPEELLRIGFKKLAEEQEKFNAAAKAINPSLNPVEVYATMTKEHSSAENLILDVRNSVEAIRQYIIDKKILTVSSEVRVKVKEMPKYLRVYAAMMDIPGPWEKNATEAYYYVTPVEPEWSQKQKEAWLENNNYYYTDIASFHEAYPGHFIQNIVLNASSATRIEKIFPSYTFTEGWAHYGEQMMIEEGYGNTGDPIKAAKYRLAQSGEALLRLCRFCMSLKMHCEGLSVDGATKFFMNNWHHDEYSSGLEAIRGTYDPRYLFYTLGKLEVLKLKEDYKKQEGANFSLQKFHDQLLENGMPPIRLLRERLLKDKTLWDKIL